MSVTSSDDPVLVRAGELNTAHIGAAIRFLLNDEDHQIEQVITAELRQINHNAGETHLTYGLGAEKEVTLEHDHPIVLNPARYFTDWPLFRNGRPSL